MFFFFLSLSIIKSLVVFEKSVFMLVGRLRPGEFLIIDYFDECKIVDFTASRVLVNSNVINILNTNARSDLRELGFWRLGIHPGILQGRRIIQS